jgi:hypothetical protein
LTEEDADDDDYVEFEDSSSSVSAMSESMNSSSGGSSGGSVMTGDSSSTFGGGDVKYGDELAHFTDRMGKMNTVAKYPWKVQKTNGKGYTPAKHCSMEGCKCPTRVFCVQYQKPYCFGLRKDVTRTSTLMLWQNMSKTSEDQVGGNKPNAIYACLLYDNHNYVDNKVVISLISLFL